MNELLFGNKIEKEALENILALNQIKKCDKEIDKYTKEIKELNEEMTNILKDEDINEEYVEKIHKYKCVLSNLEGENGRITELDSKIEENERIIHEYQEKVQEIELKLEELKKEIFETDNPAKVIDCQNEIENNNVRLNDINDSLSKLISENTPLLIEKEYLAAKNSGTDFNVPSFNKSEIQKDLERITKVFNEKVEKLDLPIRENIEFCQKKIKNREIEIEKFNARKNSVIESFPKSVNLDIDNAYDSIQNLLDELELTHGYIDFTENNIFDDEETVKEETIAKSEVVEEKEDKKENLSEDIKDEMVLLNDDEDNTDSSIDIEEDKVAEQEEIEAPKEKTTETITNEEKVETPEVTPIIEETNEETAIEEKKEETAENEEIGSVSYVLSDGESLINIAEKVYPSKDNWEAIYYFNKESIDKYLVSNGISSDFDTVKELANDTSLFTGVKLEIPTDYNYKI